MTGTTRCGTCAVPGHCCRSFYLSLPPWDRTPLEVLAFMAAYGAPFMPLFRSEGGTWRFWCPNLGRDGRCTDYDNRPDTCRVYEPESDPLCVHHCPGVNAALEEVR